MQFLDSLLYSERDVVAIAATESLGRLLPNVLNRVGRESAPEELVCQRNRHPDIVQQLKVCAAAVPPPSLGGVRHVHAAFNAEVQSRPKEQTP